MMETSNMETIYQQIAYILNDMIPEDWEKVLLYAEMREGYGQVFFYFYPLGSNTPVYSLDIEDQYDVDSQNYRSLKNQLFDCCEQLWSEFQQQGQEQWTCFTYILKHTGEMKIQYSYDDDLSQLDPTTKRERWEEKYLT